MPVGPAQPSKGFRPADRGDRGDRGGVFLSERFDSVDVCLAASSRTGLIWTAPDMLDLQVEVPQGADAGPLFLPSLGAPPAGGGAKCTHLLPGHI